MNRFIIGRIKSIRYALQGFWLLIRREDAIITHTIGLSLFIGLGYFLGITSKGHLTSWILTVMELINLTQ